MAERLTTKHDIQRDELNTIRPNFAEVTRVFVTGSIGMTYSGVDIGTGDVTVFVTGTHRELLTANRTYYVRTDGSNSNTGLADTAGGAFLTIGKLITTIQTLDGAGYAVTANLSTGTWAEAVTINNLLNISSLTINGTLTTTQSITASTGVQGTGATLGSFTRNTGTWTYNQYQYKLAKSTNGTNNGVIYPIESSTGTYMSVMGAWTAAPVNNDTFEVMDWGTIIAGTVNVTTPVTVLFFNIKFEPVAFVLSQNFARTTFTNCWVVPGSVSAFYIQQYSAVQITGCVCSTAASAIVVQALTHPTITVWNSIFVNTGAKAGTGIKADYFTSLTFSKGSLVDNFVNGITATTGAQVGFTSAVANLYSIIRNCTNGLVASNGAQQSSTTNNQYANNSTANETAVTASYGYID